MSGEELTSWLRGHQMTGAELAEVLGVERATVYRWKRNGNAPAYLHLALETLDRRMWRPRLVGPRRLPSTVLRVQEALA